MAREVWLALVCWPTPDQLYEETASASPISFAAARSCAAGTQVISSTRSAVKGRQRSR